VEHLSAAVRWLRVTIDALNDKSDPPCDSCGVARKQEWAESQAAKELRAAADKIERWMRSFGKGGAP